MSNQNQPQNQSPQPTLEELEKVLASKQQGLVNTTTRLLNARQLIIDLEGQQRLLIGDISQVSHDITIARAEKNKGSQLKPREEVIASAAP